jgi:hypothetical protein
VGGDEGDTAMVMDELYSKSEEGCQMAHASTREESYVGRMRLQGIRNRHC